MRDNFRQSSTTQTVNLFRINIKHYIQRHVQLSSPHQDRFAVFASFCRSFCQTNSHLIRHSAAALVFMQWADTKGSAKLMTSESKFNFHSSFSIYNLTCQVIKEHLMHNFGNLQNCRQAGISVTIISLWHCKCSRVLHNRFTFLSSWLPMKFYLATGYQVINHNGHYSPMQYVKVSSSRALLQPGVWFNWKKKSCRKSCQKFRWECCPESCWKSCPQYYERGSLPVLSQPSWFNWPKRALASRKNPFS